MFKSLFNFLKALFTSAEDMTGAIDHVVDFALLTTESWVDEAIAENKKKAEKLGLDPEYKEAKLKAIRKSSRQ